MNSEQVPKPSNADADPVRGWGRLPSAGEGAKRTPVESAGAVGMACSQKESCGNTGSPVGREPQGDPPDLREGQTGPGGKSERLIVPKNPGNLGGGKEPQFKDSARRGEGRGIGKSLPTQSKVGLLQEALHVKAKENPSYRFYSLYDKIWREDLLGEAWKRCRANDGVPGVDGVSFQQIEKTGVEPWLGELAKELKEKSYRPQALKRVWLKKPEGGERPIGIATVKDRVAQMAAVIVLEPIFEADLCEEQYGYRKGRNAHQAVQQIQKALKLGHRDVVDGDLSGYFDNIPHHELLKSVARRVSDGAMHTKLFLPGVRTFVVAVIAAVLTLSFAFLPSARAADHGDAPALAHGGIDPRENDVPLNLRIVGHGSGSGHWKQFKVGVRGGKANL